jgi:hypothetical protein
MARTRAFAKYQPTQFVLEVTLQLREMVDKKAIDILGNFSEAGRKEFQSLQMGTLSSLSFIRTANFRKCL